MIEEFGQMPDEEPTLGARSRIMERAVITVASNSQRRGRQATVQLGVHVREEYDFLGSGPTAEIQEREIRPANRDVSRLLAQRCTV